MAGGLNDTHDKSGEEPMPRRLGMIATCMLASLLMASGQAGAMPVMKIVSPDSVLIMAQARGGISRSFNSAARSATRPAEPARSRVAPREAVARPPAARAETAPRQPAAAVQSAPVRAQTAQQMGAQLHREVGRNRVEIKHGDGRKAIEYDLAGRGHFDKSAQKRIPAPHKSTATFHQGPTGASRTDGPVTAMTKGDVRIVRRVVEQRNAISEKKNGQ